jgi:ABC-2 type transport system permease protein
VIATMIRIGWLNLRRDRVGQALTFLLPIAFFSIFASVFGRNDERTPTIRVGIVDEDRSVFSQRIVAGLKQESALRVRETASDADAAAPLDRMAGERMVRRGDVPVAVILPSGLGAALEREGLGQEGPGVSLLADRSDPIAAHLVQGLMQKVVMTIEQREGAGRSGMGLSVNVVDVMGNGGRGSLISFYAAGIGVMFLLFSAVSGAGAALLEEAESGTLERLLSSGIGMGGVLAGKWAFLTLVGIAQLTVMFLWAWAVFGVPLFQHVPGFLVMTCVTAGAAAALGLLLASFSRTRAQLSGFSTILILTMSALGGSMFPRFLMSEGMQKVGLATFNAWALDGYLKVFWRDAPLFDLWPQVAVLTSLAAIFLAAGRLIARRWETA